MSIRTIQTPYSTTSSAASTALYPRPMSRLPSSSPRRPYHHRALGKENAVGSGASTLASQNRGPSRQFGLTASTVHHNTPAMTMQPAVVPVVKPTSPSVSAAVAAPAPLQASSPSTSSIDDPSAMDIARLVANILLRRYSGGRRAVPNRAGNGHGRGYVKSGLSAVLTVDV